MRPIDELAVHDRPVASPVAVDQPEDGAAGDTVAEVDLPGEVDRSLPEPAATRLSRLAVAATDRSA